MNTGTAIYIQVVWNTTGFKFKSLFIDNIDFHHNSPLNIQYNVWFVNAMYFWIRFFFSITMKQVICLQIVFPLHLVATVNSSPQEKIQAYWIIKSFKFESVWNERLAYYVNFNATKTFFVEKCD